MKSHILVFSILFFFIFGGCEKSDNKDFEIDFIINTKWTLSKIIANNSGVITEIPEQIDNFSIVFKKNREIELSGFCNFSYGKYKINETDSVDILNIGPSTKMYCLGELFMDWEQIFAKNFPKSKTYSIHRNQLTIFCDSDYNLVFDFIGNYSSKQGNVLFCTNSPIINCVFDIELSINNEIVDTLNAGSVYVNNECQCENTLNVGLSIDLEAGEYNYNANELNCIATNKINSWSGNFKVIEDSCTVIFLDICKE